MSTAYSYPGIYIQELPLSTQTITPAPTSITTFVGYTHPWKTTVAFGTAVQIFSFTDYQNYFGGLYTSGVLTSDVARAVYAFFLNGGNNAYVVGLQPSAYDSTDTSLGVFGPGLLAATASITQTNIGITLTATEPTDVIPMTATVANLRMNSAGTKYTIFDLVITYGTRVEVYRSVDVTIPQGQPKSLDALINNVSALVTVAPTAGTMYGTQFTSGTAPSPVNLTLALPAGFATTFSEADFLVGNAGVGAVFEENSSLDNVEIFNLLLIPGISDSNVVSAALSFAERKRAFTILDPPPQATAFQIPGSVLPTIQTMAAAVPLSQNGALYFPYLRTTDPISSMPMSVPPSGYVAGVFAATDANRGVWKAPAGLATSLLGTIGPVATGVMNDMQQGVLNSPLPGGGTPVCCLRAFASAGTVVYGSRTLVGADPAFAQSKYVPVRRMTLFIEQTLVANLKWVVFEPNDEPLWLAIKSSIEAFLLSLFNQQALQGDQPSDAFQVKCDGTTTTTADQQNGVVNIVVSVALLKPAEFVVIKIAQAAGQVS
jgi:phage tail sheath protein FI